MRNANASRNSWFSKAFSQTDCLHRAYPSQSAAGKLELPTFILFRDLFRVFLRLEISENFSYDDRVIEVSMIEVHIRQEIFIQ